MAHSVSTSTVGGSCHCKNLTFHIDVAPGSELIAWDCNCSICRMKRNVHVILPASQFHMDHAEVPLTKCEREDNLFTIHALVLREGLGGTACMTARDESES
jgi:hypothetical protein